MGDFKSDVFFDLFGFIVWIPACAGMTKGGGGNDGKGSENDGKGSENDERGKRE
jgi:hypothetical protein